MPRCNLTLKQKTQLIELSKELSTGQLAKKFRVHTTTVTRTIRKKERILQQASRVNPNFKTVQTNLRSEEHDKMMLDYIKVQQEANKPISVSDICDKAVEYAEALGREIKSQRAWWRRFRVRCNVVKSKLGRDEKPRLGVKKKKTPTEGSTVTTLEAGTKDSTIAIEASGVVPIEEDEVKGVVELLKETAREPEDLNKSDSLMMKDPDGVPVELVTITIPLHGGTGEVSAPQAADSCVADKVEQPKEVDKDLKTNGKKPRGRPKKKASPKKSTSAPRRTKKASPKNTTSKPNGDPVAATKASNKPTKNADNSTPVIHDKNFTFKVKETPSRGSTKGSNVPEGTIIISLPNP